MIIIVLIKLTSRLLVLSDGCSQNHLHPSVPCNQFHYLTVVVWHLSLPSAWSLATCLLAELFACPPTHLPATCSCLQICLPQINLCGCMCVNLSPPLPASCRPTNPALFTYVCSSLSLSWLDVLKVERGSWFQCRYTSSIHPSLHLSIHLSGSVSEQNSTNRQGSQALEQYTLNDSTVHIGR